MSTGVQHGIPMPCFSTALSFYDGYRHGMLPANLLQVRRPRGDIWPEGVGEAEGVGGCIGLKQFTCSCRPGVSGSSLKRFMWLFLGAEGLLRSPHVRAAVQSRPFCPHQLDGPRRQRLLLVLQRLKAPPHHPPPPPCRTHTYRWRTKTEGPVICERRTRKTGFCLPPLLPESHF